jgi:hypothetical protein
VDRGVAREKLEVQLDGIEQSWRFDAPPPGDGALIVRQPVENATSLGRAAHGERLRVGAQREGLVYGDATWVDARGMQTAIPARWRNGAIELDVPEATISSSSYPAVLDPTVGAMFPIGPPEAFPEGCASSPSIVSAVGQSLVTWTCSVGPYIQGIRISSDGTLVDSAPWSVGYAGSTLTPMASNGSDYCILERQQGQSALLAYAVSGQTGAVTGTFPAGDSVGGNGPVAFAYGGGVYLAAYGLDNGVSALLIDGSCTMPLMPPDVGPIVITQSPPAPQSLSVAFDGTNFLVVQSGACENQPGLQCPSVVGTRVSTTGAVVDPTPVTLVSGAGDVSVAYGGGEYLLTWTSSGGIVAAHVSPSTLAVLDAPPLSVGTSSGPADVAYGSGEFFVSWVDSTSDDVVGARVTSSVLDAPPIVIDTGVSLAGLLEHRSIRFV